jgi:hypothetical protein
MLRLFKLALSSLAIAAVLVAGCSRGTSEQPQAATASSGQAFPADPLQRVYRRSDFAALPDKGDLLGYPAEPVVHRGTTSTWYRAEVSEEHALRSVISGEMTITAPSGKPVHLKYQRHIEHPSGNWTWIGRSSDGQDAILTFGEKAVFGSIPKGRNELRLTTVKGRSWLIEVDPGKERHPEQKQPDYLVPPELAAAVSMAGSSTASMQADSVAAIPAATTTVDVALGYSTGFATDLGGDSQALTRLQHLVDVTNQAYANSQIDAQIRLVRTVSVNYPDATRNDETLDKLTGSGSIPVDPAFNQLRAVRDQYSADLVSFVRRFRAPENDGCGIAWLIGGNQSGIDNRDAPFGYSVVSDDVDLGDVNETDGKSYVCRKESLAHELGHNMGQNHNVEDSGGDTGAHSYSYGYREASTTGFYTVMAYRLANSSQRGVRYFANPNVVEVQSGRPTGIANSSDNARSLAQTMPIVATFRNTAVPATRYTKNDVDGDGRSDLFWQNLVQGYFAYWRMSGPTYLSAATYPIPSGYTLSAIVDMDGDGASDVVWSNANREVLMYRSSPNGYVPERIGVYGEGWSPLGAADVNGDHKADLLWRHAGYNLLAYWLMDGSRYLGAANYPIPAGYSFKTAADFNGDGSADVLWLDTSRHLLLWRATPLGFVPEYIGVYGVGWEIEGAGDVNGDTKADIILRDPVNGWIAYWLMDGSRYLSAKAYYMAPLYQVISKADYNGDGLLDLVWSDPSRETVLWQNSGNGFASYRIGGVGAGWTQVPGNL